MPEDNLSDHFKARENMILDELSLGIKWGRPSLITAIYRSEHTKNDLQSSLARSLQASGHRVLQYRVDKLHYDIPRELLAYPGHEQAVFFINGVRRGGGRGYSNAYRALNMHREHLVDGEIKAVFWLTETEAKQTARFAPDFWAFRHLVVEFLDLPSIQIPKPLIPTSPRLYRNKGKGLQEKVHHADWLFTMGCVDEAILHYRKTLRQYPDEPAIHLKLADIHLSMGQTASARRSLKMAGKGRMDQVLFSSEYQRVEKAVQSTRLASSGISEWKTL